MKFNKSGDQYRYAHNYNLRIGTDTIATKPACGRDSYTNVHIGSGDG